MAYGELGTNSMVYQNQGGGLQVLPLWSASAIGPFRPQWIDQLGNFRLFDWFDGDYIPLAGTTHLHGNIIPTSSNTYDLGSPTYQYLHVYTNYLTASGANITNIYSSQITSSGVKSTNVYSTNISSSLLTSSNAQIDNLYSNKITSSVINSTLYDDNKLYTGYAYFDPITHQLIDGGDLFDLPGFPIYSESVANEFKTHTHYITQSIYTGQDLTGNTDTSQMFLRGNNGNDTNPQWTYLDPTYIKSSSSLAPVVGPGILGIDNQSSYLNGRWITSSIDANSSKIVGVRKGQNVVSFFTVNDALDDTIIDVPHGGTGLSSLTKYAVLLGNNADPITFATASDAGRVLVSYGKTSFPAFGTASVVGGGTGLDSIASGQIIYGGTTANTYSKLNIGTTGQVLSVSSGKPTWSNMSTLTLSGSCNGIGQYNPTSSNITLTISAEDICAASAYHTHSANDIVSGQLAIQRIPTGTSYDTVALGNHTHANLNLIFGTKTVTYDTGYEVDFEITTQDIQDNLGIVPVSHGGTGIDDIPVGNLIVGTGTDVVNVIPPGTAGYALISNGTGYNPTYQVLPVTGGGTGLSSYQIGDIIYANSSTTLTTLHKGNQGQALIINNNVPTWSNTVPSSSWATSASYAKTATSSSFATYAKNALSSSWADKSLSSSYATYAKDSLSSSYSIEASQSFYSTYANATERLLTPFKISIHGAATAEAQYVDGQTDVQLNVYELDAHYLYGLVPFNTLPTGSTADTVAVGNHTHSTLTYTAYSGTSNTIKTYDGGSPVSLETNDGTFQLMTSFTTIAQSANLYHNHTVYLDHRNISSNTGNVTMPSTITNINAGDVITIKSLTAMSKIDKFQYTLITGSSHTVLNRKGVSETIKGSYGIDIVLTCIGKANSVCTWVYEQKPVSFVNVN